MFSRNHAIWVALALLSFMALTHARLPDISSTSDTMTLFAEEDIVLEKSGGTSVSLGSLASTLASLPSTSQVVNQLSARVSALESTASTASTTIVSLSAALSALSTVVAQNVSRVESGVASLRASGTKQASDIADLSTSASQAVVMQANTDQAVTRLSSRLDANVTALAASLARSTARIQTIEDNLNNAIKEGEWNLIFRHNTEGGFFNKNEVSRNSNNTSAALFSRLGDLESFRSSDGKFYFRLVYPDLCLDWRNCLRGANSQTWAQSSNPVTRTSGGVLGYEALDLSFTMNSWGGLEYNTNGNSLLDGAITGVANGQNFYAIGASEPWNASTPGFFAGPNSAVNKVELYISKHSSVTLQSFRNSITLSKLVQNDAAGKWTLLMRQNSATGYFQANEWRKNVNDPTASLFAILDEIESFRSDDGFFYFRMRWPGLCTTTSPRFVCVDGKEEIVWKQRSNPYTSSPQGGVLEYAPIDVPYSSQYFGGLEKCGTASALLDGSVNHQNWWYAVASTAAFQGGIPGPSIDTPGVSTAVVKLTELHVIRHTTETLQNWLSDLEVADAQRSIGEWQLVARHNAKAGYFAKGEWAKNKDDPEAQLYTRLDDLEAFRSDDGFFYFKLSWPGLCDIRQSFWTGCPGGKINNIWRQRSNPVLKTDGGVVGYEAIDVPYTGQFFYGLEHNPLASSLLDGSSNNATTHNNWYYAIGSTAAWEVLGIPGPAIGLNQYASVSLVELYVKKVSRGDMFTKDRRRRRDADISVAQSSRNEDVEELKRLILQQQLEIDALKKMALSD